MTEPLRKHVIDGLEVVVFDGLFPDDYVARMFEQLTRSVFGQWESDSPDQPVQFKTWVHGVDPEVVMAEPLYVSTAALLRAHFPGPNELYRAYCNNTAYGDPSFIHLDCSPGERDVTALYYANPRWDAEWDGETLFYDSDRETQVAVRPRPGRLVLFHGSIPHKATPPSRLCYEPRLTVALKFRAPRSPDGERAA